jgi:phage terminase large subunit GpA-like protein
MKIQHILSESGNDFTATMECEHCGSTQRLSSGYHDNFYHTQVVPAMTCRACGKNRAGDVPEAKNDSGAVSVSA